MKSKRKTTKKSQKNLNKRKQKREKATKKRNRKSTASKKSKIKKSDFKNLPPTKANISKFMMLSHKYDDVSDFFNSTILTYIYIYIVQFFLLFCKILSVMECQILN